MEQGGGGSGGSAPTGCYKCGRPGHWSRDCPVNSNSDSTDNQNGNPKDNDYNPKTATSYPSKKKVVTEKPKGLPRSRPKLTPDLLLSNDGLGHILRHFPRAFKYHGRGHEVTDLRNLLALYAEWHSQLIPYYSFDQFVHKVEQVGTTKRVKKCIRELREKIASGQDPSKLHEVDVQPEISSHVQYSHGTQENTSAVEDTDSHGTQENTSAVEDSSLQNPDKDNLEENMLNDLWEQAIEDPPPQPSGHSGDEGYSGGNKETNLHGTCSAVVIPEEQRARMEANRLKALERAAARKQSLLP